jgi:hypothetical protein
MPCEHLQWAELEDRYGGGQENSGVALANQQIESGLSFCKDINNVWFSSSTPATQRCRPALIWEIILFLIFVIQLVA